jgi:lipopolysaccharide export LptBFGC system permease protein LptF
MRIRGRATALASFGISFAVGFIYYVSDAIALAFGKAGILPPFLAASAGHLFFLGLGIYLILELT